MTAVILLNLFIIFINLKSIYKSNKNISIHYIGIHLIKISKSFFISITSTVKIQKQVIVLIMYLYNFSNSH